MELLDERPVWSMSDSELLTALDDLDADIARKQTRRLQLVARIDQTGQAEELGARDAIELLALRYRQNRRDAHRDVKLARALPKYHQVSTALTEGVPATDPDDQEPAGPVPGETGPGETGSGDRGWLLRPAQAAAIVSGLERVRSRVPVEDLDVAEHQLVGLAAHLSPDELRTTTKQICDLLDSDGPEPDEHQAYARESLTLTPADNGVKFRGYLANDNAELLRTLTHAGARPHKTLHGEPDPRSRDKRQADALTHALTIAAAATDAGYRPTSDPANDSAATPDDATTSGRGAWVPGFGAKANITVTIDFNDLKTATANATGHLVHGDALSAATIRRLACDARILPLVLGTNSEPLDVGRSERLVTRAMRRALNARDKGCVVCGAPPIMCDAHHLHSWLDGGPTAIDNLALLCRAHHRALHHGHWTITITNGTVHVTRPTWADPPRNTTPPAPPPRPSHPLTPPDPPSQSTNSPPEQPEHNATTTPPEPTTASLQEATYRAIWGENPVPQPDPPTPSQTTAPTREATYRTIWGENPTPQPDQPTPDRITPSRSRQFDPWAESPTATSSDPSP